MNKVFEKIYSENNSSTNIALFIASIFALIIYLTIRDLVIVTISSVGVFAFTKVISKIFSNVIFKWAKKRKLVNSLSESEKATIQSFTSKGTTFIRMSDYDAIGGEGLDSLVSREIIWYIDTMDEPSGFKLDEEIYQAFLDK